MLKKPLRSELSFKRIEVSVKALYQPTRKTSKRTKLGSSSQLPKGEEGSLSLLSFDPKISKESSSKPELLYMTPNISRRGSLAKMAGSSHKQWKPVQKKKPTLETLPSSDFRNKVKPMTSKASLKHLDKGDYYRLALNQITTEQQETRNHSHFRMSSSIKRSQGQTSTHSRQGSFSMKSAPKKQVQVPLTIEKKSMRLLQMEFVAPDTAKSSKKEDFRSIFQEYNSEFRQQHQEQQHPEQNLEPKLTEQQGELIQEPFSRKNMEPEAADPLSEWIPLRKPGKRRSRMQRRSPLKTRPDLSGAKKNASLRKNSSTIPQKLIGISTARSSQKIPSHRQPARKQGTSDEQGFAARAEAKPQKKKVQIEVQISIPEPREGLSSKQTWAASPSQALVTVHSPKIEQSNLIHLNQNQDITFQALDKTLTIEEPVKDQKISTTIRLSENSQSPTREELLSNDDNGICNAEEVARNLGGQASADLYRFQTTSFITKQQSPKPLELLPLDMIQSAPITKRKLMKFKKESLTLLERAEEKYFNSGPDEEEMSKTQEQMPTEPSQRVSEAKQTFINQSETKLRRRPTLQELRHQRRSLVGSIFINSSQLEEMKAKGRS